MSHGLINTYEKGHKCKNWDISCGVENCEKHKKIISACGNYLEGKEIDCFVCKDFEEDND